MTLHFSCTVAAPHTGHAIASSALSIFVASVGPWLASLNSRFVLPRSVLGKSIVIGAIVEVLAADLLIVIPSEVEEPLTVPVHTQQEMSRLRST